MNVPEQVSVAMAEIAGNMREGLLALAIGAGLQVMRALMDADVTALVGPKGRHGPACSAVRHGNGGEQVTEVATATSKSAVSRRFVAQTETALARLLTADLSGLDLVAFMVDGVHFAESCCVVALGITLDGTNVPLPAGRGARPRTPLWSQVSPKPRPYRDGPRDSTFGILLRVHGH